MIVGWKSTWFDEKIVVLHLILAPIHVHLMFIDQEPAFHPFPVVRNPRRSVASWNPMFGSTIPTNRSMHLCLEETSRNIQVFQTLIAGSSLFGGILSWKKKTVQILPASQKSETTSKQSSPSMSPW
jgi:hypothetical protein